MRVSRNLERLDRMATLAADLELPGVRILMAGHAVRADAGEPPGGRCSRREGSRFNAVTVGALEADVPAGERESGVLVRERRDRKVRPIERVARLAPRSHLTGMHVGVARHAGVRRLRQPDAGHSRYRRRPWCSCSRRGNGRRAGWDVALRAGQRCVHSGKERTRPRMVERGNVERSCRMAGVAANPELALVHVRVTGRALGAQPAEVHDACRRGGDWRPTRALTSSRPTTRGRGSATRWRSEQGGGRRLMAASAR
jgi:hypothetical protein